MTDNNNKRKISPAAWVVLGIFTAAQLVSWGTMKQSLSSMETSLDKVERSVTQVSVMLTSRMVAQENKFYDRMLLLEERLWDIQTDLNEVYTRSFASQLPRNSGNPL